MALRISIVDEVGNPAWTFDEHRIKRIVRRILADHEKTRGEVSIALLDNRMIRRLNRRYLHHDWNTDCLSFVLDEDHESIFGEVVASIEMAYRVAPGVGWRGEDELLLYMIHGALHLVGLDDQDRRSRQRMREAELRYLKIAKVPRVDEFLKDTPGESLRASPRRKISKPRRT